MACSITAKQILVKKCRFGSFTFFLFFLQVLSLPTYAQQKANTCGLSKQYAIAAAQLADQSYTFAENARFVNNPQLANSYMDTAMYFINQSITALDSAVFFAADSDLVALKYAGISKKYAHDANGALLSAIRSTGFLQKRELAEQSTFLSANAVVEAYHASFYFTGKCNTTPEEAALVEALLTQADFDYKLLEIQVTKLDVDQTLFSLLMIQLNERMVETTTEIDKLSRQLKTEKDPARLAKLKEQIKKLQLKENDYTYKSKGVTEKLNQINTQIEERGKNKVPATNESTVFSKSTRLPKDQWNTPVMMDVDMPEGLVYQVQIGIYKNAIAPQIFKGLTPLYGITTKAGISYSTGMFEKLADATEAKNYVKSMGLTDSFVTAYFNKKRITTAEAQKLEKK